MTLPAVSYSLYKEKRFFFSSLYFVMCSLLDLSSESVLSIKKRANIIHQQVHLEVFGIDSPGIYERCFLFLGKLLIILLAK